LILSIKARRYLLIGIPAVVILALGIVARIPAWQAYQWLAGDASQVVASDFSGTLWQGRAGRVTVSGYSLGTLEWKLAPVGLLAGNLQVDLDLAGREVSTHATLLRPLVGSGWRAENVIATGPATWLQVILQEPFLQLHGEIEMDLSAAAIDEQGWLTRVVGHCRWRGASVGGTLVTDLGDLSVTFTTDSAGIVGQLADAGGPLGLAGTVIVKERQYEVDAYLHARADVVELRQALLIFGRPGPDGWTHLGITGPMLPLSGWTQ
jgi:general secretion pathway protein N